MKSLIILFLMAIAIFPQITLSGYHDCIEHISGVQSKISHNGENLVWIKSTDDSIVIMCMLNKNEGAWYEAYVLYEHKIAILGERSFIELLSISDTSVIFVKKLYIVSTDGKLTYAKNGSNIMRVHLKTQDELTTEEYISLMPDPLHTYPVVKVYPNPSNPTVTINYTVTAYANVKVEAFDIEGKSVGVITSGLRNAGRYETIWDPIVASGKYLIKVWAGARTGSAVITIVK